MYINKNNIYMCIYICVNVCMYVRTYVCMYACVYVCVPCMYVCMHAYVYVWGKKHMYGGVVGVCWECGGGLGLWGVW